MQATLTTGSTDLFPIQAKKQTNGSKLALDLDWLGQQSIADLQPRAPEFLAYLAEARAALGEDDPFGTARFDPDTPVVVVLRALARVELASAVAMRRCQGRS